MSESDKGSNQPSDLPQLEPWQFQPDNDSPGLYLQCSSAAQRDAIMRALGAPVWSAQEMNEADREAAKLVENIRWE